MATYYQDRLTAVRARIEVLRDRKASYSISDPSGVSRSATEIQLRELLDEEKYLIPLAAREAGGGGIKMRFATPL